MKLKTISAKHILLFVLLIICYKGYSQQRIKAGISRINITPSIGLEMRDGKKNDTATGVHDSLSASIIVFDSGNNSVAIVTIDYLYALPDSLLSVLRKKVYANCGIKNILLQGSHNHSGPYLAGIEKKEKIPGWLIKITDRIGLAVEDAYKKREAVKISVGYGYCTIGHNRRYMNDDGKITMMWSNIEKIPTAPLDSTVSVMRIDKLNNQPLAVLVNYACHPVIFGPTNSQYTADYPGVMRKTVEQSLQGGPLCIFLQGGCGDIDPYYTYVKDPKDAADRAKESGVKLGNEVLRILNTCKSIESDVSPLIQFQEDTLAFKPRWKKTDYEVANKNSYRLPVAVLLINKSIGFITMPGEPFVDFQIEWRKKCPVKNPFFMGYTNGSFGYLPTIKAAAEGGYGAADVSTYVEPGAGEALFNHGLIILYQFLDKLTDKLKEDYFK